MKTLEKPIVGALVFAGYLGTANADEAWLESARKRQEAVKTIQAELKVNKHYLKREPADDEKRSSIPARPEDVSVEYTAKLLIVGSKVRSEENSPLWFRGRGFVDIGRLVDVWDGERATSYFPRGPGGNGEPVAVIEQENPWRYKGATIYSPITLNYRAFDPGIEPRRLAEARSTGETLDIGGTSCLEVVIARGDFAQRLWLDPRRDHAVRRWDSLRNGRVNSRLDVDYREAEGGLEPSSWTHSEFDDRGRTVSTTQIKMQSLRLNEPIAADEFDPTFPVGCIVHDNRIRKEFRVEPDGDWKEVDLRHAPAAEAPAPEAPHDGGIRWIVLSALMAAFVLFVVIIRRQRKITPPGASESAP